MLFVLGCAALRRSHAQDRINSFRWQLRQAYGGTRVATKIFEKYKPGRNVAILRGSSASNGALFRQPASHSIQGFICQVVGRRALFAVKIRNQPAAHLEISLAVGITT